MVKRLPLAVVSRRVLRYVFSYPSLLLLAAITLTSCMFFIPPIPQPGEAVPGQTIHIDLQGYVYSDDPVNNPVVGYFGISLPTGTHLTQNNIPVTGKLNGTLVYSSTLTAEAEKIAHRPGYTWWVGYSPSGVFHIGDNFIASITVTLGSETGFYNLEYGFASSSWASGYPERRMAPLTVTAPSGAGWAPHDITFYGKPGHMRQTKVRLVNLGSSADSFDLVPAGWARIFSGGESITRTPELAPLDGITLTVELTIPTDAAVGVHPAAVEAVSVNTPASVSTLWIETNVLPEYYIIHTNNIYQSRLLGPFVQYDYGIQLPSGVGRIPSAFSPDHRWLMLSDGDSPDVWLMNLDNPADVTTLNFGHINHGTRGAFSFDSRYALILHNNSKTLRVVDMETLTVTHVITTETYLSRVAALPGGTLAFVAVSSGIGVIDWSGPGIIKTIELPDNIQDWDLSPDAKHLYVIRDAPANIYVIDTATQSLEQILVLPGVTFSSIKVSLDNKYLYVGSIPQARFYVLDAATGAVVWDLQLYWPYPIASLPGALKGLVYVSAMETSHPHSQSYIMLLDTRSRQVIGAYPMQGGKLNLVLPDDYGMQNRLFIPFTERE